MKNPMPTLYALKSISKGYSVYFFVLLPILYAQNTLSASQVGYIGALSIACIILGAYTVAQWLHAHETRTLLIYSAIGVTATAGLLLVGAAANNGSIITTAYILFGTILGVMTVSVDSVTATLTVKGARYTSIARIAVASDVVRIVLPIVLAGALSLGNVAFSFLFVLIASGLFIRAVRTVPHNLHLKEQTLSIPGKLRHNTAFRYFLSIEFLDSFSSAQLFVFLPILFLAKGYSVENSLLMQTAIFLGYMSGRIIVSKVANKHSGQIAVAYAEVGMALSIIALLVSTNLIVLYALSYILGVFTRGTSPTIKALTFDTLDESQTKRGVAVYVMAGDTGSALAQLLFGLLVTWYGVNWPFIVSAVLAASVALMIFFTPKRSTARQR